MTLGSEKGVFVGFHEQRKIDDAWLGERGPSIGFFVSANIGKLERVKPSAGREQPIL